MRATLVLSSAAKFHWGIGIGSRAWRGVATALLVVMASGACTGGGSGSAPAPTPTGHGTPDPSPSTAPTAGRAESPSGIASSEPTEVDSDGLLPDEIDGVVLIKERVIGLRGQTVEGGSLEARIVDRLGIDEDDYQLINAFPSDASALPVAIVAYRYAGARPAEIRSVILDELRSFGSIDGPAAVRDLNLGGKEVTHLEYGLGPVYLWFAGDRVIQVSAQDDATATRVFDALQEP